MAIADFQVVAVAGSHSIHGMAIFGSLVTVRRLCARFPEFSAAFAYAGEALAADSAVHARIMGMPGGSTHREELPGGACVVEMTYRTKPRPEGYWMALRNPRASYDKVVSPAASAALVRRPESS